jgi:TRAP-type C4-dicarboxylate transport system substrate-binding protein
MTRVTASPMAVLMNRSAYDALSDADRAVIDEMSGRAAAEWIAEVVDATDAEIEAQLRADGKVIFIDLDPAQRQAWEDALSGAPAKWVAQQSEQAAADAVLTRATEMSAQH